MKFPNGSVRAEQKARLLDAKRAHELKTDESPKALWKETTTIVHSAHGSIRRLGDHCLLRR
jgi:hypothetical protein